MNAHEKTFGSPSGEPSTTRSMLQQMCEKVWTLPRIMRQPLPPACRLSTNSAEERRMRPIYLRTDLLSLFCRRTLARMWLVVAAIPQLHVCIDLISNRRACWNQASRGGRPLRLRIVTQPSGQSSACPSLPLCPPRGQILLPGLRLPSFLLGSLRSS